MNFKGLITMAIICANFVAIGLVMSLQPAFYPTEAEQKGAKPSQYGLVFGIVSLAAFVTSPIFAKYGSRMGPKLVYIVGGFVQGGANALFGLLEFVDNTGWFIGISYILRLVEGIAQVASNAAILAILTALYPSHVASLTSVTESLMGAGYMIGPIVGSLLYTLGGFGLPFYLLGGAIVLLTLCLIVFVPKVDFNNTEKEPLDDGASHNSVTLLAVAKQPLFVLPLLDNCFTMAGNGMVESMLEPHMKNSEAKATQMEVALAFTICGGGYMVFALIAGAIADNMKYPTILTILGQLLLIVSFFFLGPAPYFKFTPTVPMTYAAAAGIGAGCGLSFASTMARLHKAAERLGYKRDVHTNMILSSLWVGSFSLGNFVGPSVAGFLIEAIGFRHSTVYFQAIFEFALVMDVIILVYTVTKFKNATESRLTNRPSQ